MLGICTLQRAPFAISTHFMSTSFEVLILFLFNNTRVLLRSKAVRKKLSKTNKEKDENISQPIGK